MTKTNFYRTIFTFTTVFLTGILFGQSKTTVKISADKNQILLGEQIVLSLEVDVPENEPIRFFQIDTLPHFEILAREKIDTSNTGTGTVLRQLIHITSFDSGHWVIPRLVLIDSVTTDSIPVDVGFSSPFDPQQPYHDIKEIIEVKPPEKKKQEWWYYAVGGGLLLLIILYFLLRKKKKPVIKVEAPPIDPYQEALTKLEELKKKKLASKEYYTEVVDIFRVYLEKRKGIQSLQTTSDDLISQLKPLNIPGELFTTLSKSLRYSDFVKFAKYIPSPEDDRDIFNAVNQSIQWIEQNK